MKSFYASILVLLHLFICTNTVGQNIGIGTTVPQSKLDIKGNLSVGSGYSGNYAAPTNGVIIQGQEGIGTYSPDPSAALDITSVSQGILVPRMNTSQVNSISNPATGLLIFNNDSSAFFYFNGKAWINLSSSGPSGPTGATGTNGTNGVAGPTGAAGADGSDGSNGATGATGATGPTGTNGWLLTGNNTTSTSFLGTTDNVSLYLRTNNTQRMTIDSAGNVGVGATPLATGFSAVYDYPGKNVITIENSSSTGYSSMDFWNNSGTLSTTFGFANSGTGSFFTSSAYMNSYGNNFILTSSSGSYNIFILGSNGNVGINTNTPQNAFDVKGGVAIGTYGGANSAPTNGLIVSGNVGIATTTINSTLQDGGSLGLSIRTHSGSTILSATDFCVVNTAAVADTFTLPVASTCTGREYIITNHGSASLTTSISFTTGSSSTSSTVLTGASVQIISDGSVWRKVN